METTNVESSKGYARTSDENNRVVTVGDWFVTILLLAIPVVNIIMMFVWAFGGGVSESKKNYAKASLIWVAIGLAIMFIIVIISMMLGASMGSNY